MKPLVTYDDFAKLDFRVGKIIQCEPKEGSEKLLRLKVNFGIDGERNILTGIAPWYTPEELIGKSYIFAFNIEPRKLMGEDSEGMILATDTDKPILLTASDAPAGSSIR